MWIKNQFPVKWIFYCGLKILSFRTFYQFNTFSWSYQEILWRSLTSLTWSQHFDMEIDWIKRLWLRMSVTFNIIVKYETLFNFVDDFLKHHYQTPKLWSKYNNSLFKTKHISYVLVLVVSQHNIEKNFDFTGPWKLLNFNCFTHRN